MGLHLSLSLSGQQVGTITGPSYSLTITGLTGGVARIGVELTAVANNWRVDGETASAPGSVAWQWYDGSGALSGATSATYTPVSGDNLETIYVIATPSETYDPKQSGGYPVAYAPPAEDAAPVASGDAVIGESLTGTSGTFTGSDLTIGSEWEVSDDGSTGWTGTGDTDTTSPAQASGKYYRFASTAENSGGSLTTYSNVIGPAVAPTISMSGLTSGDAIIGDHASITMAANVGTITARKWGSTSGGSQFGTGTNPTDFTAADGGTLYATATVGGIDYTIGADVIYTAPVAAAGLDDVSYSTGSGDQTVDASADFTGGGIVYTVSTGLAGVTIDSGTGVVTISTGSDATGTVTVTGTNSGGADSTAFSVTISAGVVAPVLSNIDASGAPDGLELDVDIACDLYWSLDPVGTNPDGDTIIAGGITDSGGPDAISSGANVIAFDFSAIAAGTYDLSFVASNSGALSNVLRQEITLADAGTWAITGSDNTLTVTDQPTAPATPTISGGELTLTVTG